MLFLFISQLNTYSQTSILFDAVTKKIEFQNFYLDNIKLEGDLIFDIKQNKDFLIFNLDSKNISIEDKFFPYLKLKFIKKQNTIIIKEFSSPEFIIKGKFNLSSGDILLDIDVNSYEKYLFLGSKLNLKAKLWGKIPNSFITGTMTIEDGRFQDVEFDYLVVDFFSNMLVVDVIDARIALKDGSSYRFECTFDIKNFYNIFSTLEFISEKIVFGDWKLLQDRENVTFKKEVDRRFDIVFDIQKRDSKEINSGTELRYKMKNGNFLKLRIEDDRDIIGFEHKKEF